MQDLRIFADDPRSGGAFDPWRACQDRRVYLGASSTRNLAVADTSFTRVVTVDSPTEFPIRFATSDHPRMSRPSGPRMVSSVYSCWMFHSPWTMNLPSASAT